LRSVPFIPAASHVRCQARETPATMFQSTFILTARAIRLVSSSGRLAKLEQP
jgi:hypothetical protein